MTGCRMNPGCDSLKKRRYAARFAAIYADQASVPNEVCHFNILSINRVHEVAGHFFASVLDKNEQAYFVRIAVFCRRILQGNSPDSSHHPLLL